MSSFLIIFYLKKINPSNSVWDLGGAKALL